MSYILVIGANSDIVKALLPLYAKQGYALHLTGRNTNALQQQARSLQQTYSIQTKVSFLDINDLKSHDLFCKTLETTPLGVICACGYLGENPKPTLSKSENLTSILATNYTGPVHFFETFLDIHCYEKAGSDLSFIIGISSVAGDRGKQSNYLYGSSKAGFSVYLSGLRQKLFKKNIFVLTVKPGYVISQMIQHKQDTIPSFLLSTPEKVSLHIVKAHKQKKAVLYTPHYWKWLCFIFSILPDFIFKRLTL